MFPQIFGKYVLERPIAMGGMAKVFLATLRGAGGFEKRLVVKQIRAELAIDDAFVRRFVAEAKTTVELSHPNIVPVYELGVEQGIYYLAMELCDGATLAELLATANRLTPEEGAYVGIEICRALDYAHRKAQVVHRDVTPRNVVIDEEGAIRLIDFGIAAPASAGAKDVFGSPGHMPPEQLRGGEVGPPTDVFAAATLLYEAWSGSAPFRRATPEASERALTERLPPLTAIDPTFAAIEELIASSLALDPAERPQSAEDLSRPLRRFIAGADLGDLARKLGARVKAHREAARETALDDGSEAAPEATAGHPATRTFATRALDEPRAPRSEDPSRATRPLDGPRPPAESPNLATRKMQEEGGSSPKGDPKGGRWPWSVGVGVALLGAAVAAGSAFRAPPTRTAPSGSATASSGAQPSPLGALADASDAEPPPANITEPPPARAATTAAANPPAADSASPARLRVLSTPPADVEIDGHPRGTAPLDVPLTPGTHLVRLACAPLGETVSQNVRVAPGESVTLSGDFTGARGRILVRRSAANP